MKANKKQKKWANHDMCTALYRLKDLCQEIAGKYHLRAEQEITKAELSKLQQRTRQAMKFACARYPDRTCFMCGCSENDCSLCIERTGHPCHWVGPNLCSACS